MCTFENLLSLIFGKSLGKSPLNVSEALVRKVWKKHGFFMCKKFLINVRVKKI